MFEIGFGELLLVMIIGLIVLGPERLPVAVRTVAGWIKAMRSLAASVQNELTQELKLQELQESLKKVEQKVTLQTLSPELKASMDELKSAAQAMQRSYKSDLNPEPAQQETADATEQSAPVSETTSETASVSETAPGTLAQEASAPAAPLSAAAAEGAEDEQTQNLNLDSLKVKNVSVSHMEPEFVELSPSNKPDNSR